MKMFTLKTVAVANENCPAVKEAMTKTPVTVTANETVAEAIYKMDQKKILRLPVVTETGLAAGIITKFDIRAKQAELAEFNTELPGTCPVSKLAKPVVTINENKNVADAYNMLNDEDVKSLVVVDNFHKVVGMITKNDIAKLEAKEDEDEAEAEIGVNWHTVKDDDDDIFLRVIFD